MSIKNYTGLRFNTANGVEEALNALSAQKQAVLDLCNEKTTAWIATRATAFVDALTLRQAAERGEIKLPSQAQEILTQKDDFYIFASSEERAWGVPELLTDTQPSVIRAFREIDHRQNKCRGSMARDVDIDCDVQLFVHWDPKQKCLLAHMQEEGVGARQHLLDSKAAEDFSYQNSTDDLPKGVSRRAYEQRGKIWEEANRNPGSLSFTLSWAPDWRPDNTADIFHHLESAQVRALRYANRESLNAYLEVHYDPSGNPGRVAGPMYDHRKLLEDPASREHLARNELAERFEKILLDGKRLQAAIDMRICDLAVEAPPEIEQGKAPKP